MDSSPRLRGRQDGKECSYRHQTISPMQVFSVAARVSRMLYEIMGLVSLHTIIPILLKWLQYISVIFDIRSILFKSKPKASIPKPS